MITRASRHPQTRPSRSRKVGQIQVQGFRKCRQRAGNRPEQRSRVGLAAT
jgi:hypothetical protein